MLLRSLGEACNYRSLWTGQNQIHQEAIFCLWRTVTFHSHCHNRTGVTGRMWSMCSGRAASTLLLQGRAEAAWPGVRPDGARLAHQNLSANLSGRVGSCRVCATHHAATKLLICSQGNRSAATRFIVSLGCKKYFGLEILLNSFVHKKTNTSYIRWPKQLIKLVYPQHDPLQPFSLFPAGGAVCWWN